MTAGLEGCPGNRWATLPRGRARCADCGREFGLIGRNHAKGWGRTRLPNHKRPIEKELTDG